MKTENLFLQVASAFAGNPNGVPKPDASGNDKTKEVSRFVEQTKGTHMVFDTNSNELVAFTSSAPEFPEDHKAKLIRKGQDPNSLWGGTLEEAVQSLAETLDPARGAEGVVLSAVEQDSAAMAMMSPGAGLSRAAGHLLFDSALEDAGFAGELGVKTVIMWSEPESGTLHIASSTEYINTWDLGFNDAFPERVELTSMPVPGLGEAEVFAKKVSGGAKQLAPLTPMKGYEENRATSSFTRAGGDIENLIDKLMEVRAQTVEPREVRKPDALRF